MNPREYLRTNDYKEGIFKEEKVEKDRKFFLEKYPLEKIGDLTLDDYLFAAEGVANDLSFCRLLKNLRTSSMGQNRQSIFGIYYNNKGEINCSNEIYLREFNSYHEAALDFIKSEMINLLDNISNGNYSIVENCVLNSAFKYKLITAYYPELLIPVVAKNKLKDYCDILGVHFDDADEMIYNNLRLKEWKDTHVVSNEWSNYIFMYYVDYLCDNNLLPGNTELIDFTSKEYTILEERYMSLKKDQEESLFPETDVPTNSYEGAVKQTLVNRYERSALARSKCIEYYGCKCYICGTDFEEEYGELGKGFIHVHHVIPLNEIGKEYQVDPVKDLIPICPNCHSMIHRKKEGGCYSPDEFKDLYNKLHKRD